MEVSAARVYIDSAGIPIHYYAERTFYLSAGKHTVEIELAGAKSCKKIVKMTGSAAQILNITLEKNQRE